jgi:NCAIR mutase (PurE)-related protein
MNVRSEILLDVHRRQRMGLDEAVYCAGKSVAHILEILRQVEERAGRMLLTRLDQAKFDGLPEPMRARLDFDPLSATAFFPDSHPPAGRERVAVIAAGTSDAAVAREASRTLLFSGETPLHIADVGVAGLWRLMDRLEEIRSARVVVAVAGMDAALPTVLAGLIDAPIVGVPTSVGYGAAEGGQTALKAMLASCASGLAVTNIDNGYGGACAALRILRAIES